MISNSKESIQIFWFRRDLRLEDNTALLKSLQSGKPVLPVFVFDTNIIEELPVNDARVSFIYDQLKMLNKKLAHYGSGVLIIKDKPLSAFNKLINTYNIDKVLANKDYEPYAIERDRQIAKLLKSKGAELILEKDQVIFEEYEVVKVDGNPYTVFTPFKNKWLSVFQSTNVETAKAPQNPKYFKSNTRFPSIEDLGFQQSDIKVRSYNLQIDRYEKERDIPSLDATSYLGPHLRFGTVSIRKIVEKIRSNMSFFNELIWREFFMMILFHYPDVVTENFKSKYNGVIWRSSEDDFQRWKSGTTGYPMVDAGMRQLNATGFMHNRVRMVTAGFLCKHLLIDWRWGEAYFAEKLLDYELSSNNGNWQWAAGTGCDAAPYFRIFNPEQQLKKFDKDLLYIKNWIPEYGKSTYPKPMVDHKMARERALNAYKQGIIK